MCDPKQIWLQPNCCTCPYDGRQWCEDDVFECDDGNPSVEYTRADLAAKQIERLEAENEELKRQLARMREVMECNDPGNVPEA